MNENNYQVLKINKIYPSTLTSIKRRTIYKTIIQCTFTGTSNSVFISEFTDSV